MSESCASIIDSLIELRHKRGMTQKELANRACLTQSVIARFETKKAIPQLDTLLKVADALGCDLILTPAAKAMTETIVEGIKTPISDCVPESEVKW